MTSINATLVTRVRINQSLLKFLKILCDFFNYQNLIKNINISNAKLDNV